MNRKSIIISIKGTVLTNSEKSLINSEKPWGVILFKRNIKTISQLEYLSKEIRNSIKDPNYPILIDEEGGNVSRLSNIVDTKIFSQNFFGHLYEKNKTIGYKYYVNYLNQISYVLRKIGVNINTIPVLDIFKNKKSKIIGTRSYSKRTQTIKSLGRACINTLKKNKIGSVIKHIPGHGCTDIDSHKSLPIVSDSYKNLIKNDFSLFKENNSPFAMTAHILYKKIDSFYPATHSKIIIDNIIRKKLLYKGLLISDDISMKSLSKNIIFNAKKAVFSGCNLALYCGGEIKESSILLKNMKKIDAFTSKKTSEFYNFLR